MSKLAHSIRERLAGRQAVILGQASAMPELEHLGWPVRTLPNAHSAGSLPSIFQSLTGSETLVCCFPAMEDGYASRNFLVQLTEQLFGFLEGGGKLISLEESSLRHADHPVFSPTISNLHRQGSSLLALLHDRPIEIRCERTGFSGSVHSRDWEIEATDPDREPNFQLPGGEVFTHFDCTWSGRLPFGGSQWTLVLDNGVVRGIEGLAGRNAWVGMPLTELGFGSNPGAGKNDPVGGEKALGTVHIGLGRGLPYDLQPPFQHFDLMLPVEAIDFHKTDPNHAVEISLF